MPDSSSAESRQKINNPGSEWDQLRGVPFAGNQPAISSVDWSNPKDLDFEGAFLDDLRGSNDNAEQGGDSGKVIKENIDYDDDENPFNEAMYGLEEDDEKPETTEEEKEETQKNKVELGNTELLPVAEKIDIEKQKRCEELEKKLEEFKPDLAELYAKNRRLIVGSKNRQEFLEAKAKYGEMLDEYLKLKADAKFESGKEEIYNKIGVLIKELGEGVNADLLEFVGGDPENTEKTQKEVDEERERLRKEATEKVNEEYTKLIGELKGQVNAEFLSDYLEQAGALEDATIDKLDNGTKCRKFVSKVLKNKWLKRVMIGAGVVGLAATGVGLLAAGGAMTVGFGLTAGGVVAGAARGAGMGALMSRQDSKTSEVRNFVNEDNVPEEVKNINILDQNSDAANVADWMMGEYEKANKADEVSNKKKTAAAAGIGAVIGGLMSGVHIDNVVTVEKTVGHKPVSQVVDMSKIDIHQGSGMSETFSDLGGNPDNLQRAIDIAHGIDSKYGMVPGSNGETIGLNGAVGDFAHTYPGTIDTWPDEAQSYITEVAQKWAEAGLIPADQVGGEAIKETVTKYIPNAFWNFIVQASTASAIGGATSAIVDRNKTSERPDNISIEEQPEPEEEAKPKEETETNSDNAEVATESDGGAETAGSEIPDEFYERQWNECSPRMQALLKDPNHPLGIDQIDDGFKKWLIKTGKRKA